MECKCRKIYTTRSLFCFEPINISLLALCYQPSTSHENATVIVFSTQNVLLIGCFFIILLASCHYVACKQVAPVVVSHHFADCEGPTKPARLQKLPRNLHVSWSRTLSLKQNTMMRAYKHPLITLFALAVSFSACDNRTESRLEQIDSLLNQGNVEKAYELVQAIPPHEMDNSDEMAYYTLLKTEATYRNMQNIDNDSIDLPVFYYEQHGPKDRLARAYYYKACILFFNRDNVTAAIKLLKKAENTAKGYGGMVLMHKIYSTISYVNLTTKNYNTALNYAEKARNLGIKANNKMWQAYSLTYTANAYSGMALCDSNLHYLLKALELYKYLDSENQTVLLANISDVYCQMGDTVKSAKFIRRALKERPDSYTYTILTDLYMRQGEYGKAFDLLQKAMASRDVYTREKALYNLFKLKQQTGDYVGAADIADTLIMFKDKQQQEWQANNIYEIQNKFDIEASERQLRSYRIYMAGLALVLVLAVVLLVLYHKYKVTRAKRSILEKRLLISEYSDRIDQFKHSQTEANKELNSLRQRVNNLKDKELKVLSNGKLLYESILQNHSTVHWSNADFFDFIEYCKFSAPSFFSSLDNTYNNLSARQYLFLIVTTKMGKSENDAGDILGISPGSVRSIKSRIKTKRKA